METPAKLEERIVHDDTTNLTAKTKNENVPDIPMDVFLKILSHAHWTVAHNFLQTCSHARRLTVNFHPELKKIPMQKLICRPLPDGVFVARFDNDISNAMFIAKTDLKQLLHKCCPTHFVFDGSDELADLSKNWWKGIEKLSLHLHENTLNRYLNVLQNCCELELKVTEHCRATEIANCMGSLQKLKLIGSNIEVDDSSLIAFEQAINRGKGLISLQISTFESRPVVSFTAYIDFIQSFKISSPANPFFVREIIVGPFNVNETFMKIFFNLKRIFSNLQPNGDGFQFRTDFENAPVLFSLHLNGILSSRPAFIAFLESRNPH